MSFSKKPVPWLNILICTFLLIGLFSHEAKAQTSPGAPTPASSHRAKLLLKLKTITLSVNFDKTDIATVLDFLSKKSKELDPEKVGINFVLRLPDAPAKDATPAKPQPKIHREVSVTLDSISLIDLLKEISQQTNLQCSVEDYAVYLHPLN